MGYKIISACDKNYFGFLEILVKSAKRNFSDASIYVELVNMDEQAKGIIERISPKCEAEVTTIDFKNPNQLKCYCTNRRVDLFNELRSKCDDILIWIDADSIIRRSCSELMEIISAHDVSAVIRPPPVASLRAGIIAINNTEEGNRFIKKYVEIMKPLNQWNKAKDTKRIQSDPFTWECWMANQNCLDVLCRRNKRPELRFAALDNLYCDVHFKKEGYIWAAKNLLKTSPAYHEELKKYG